MEDGGHGISSTAVAADPNLRPVVAAEQAAEIRAVVPGGRHLGTVVEDDQ